MFPVLATLSASATASADRSPQDIASARQLYNDGEALRDKGDLKGALEKFKAAHALGDTPITGIELCKTHRALNQPVEAREACLSVGRIAPLKEESQRSKDARAEAAKIAESEKPKIGSITLKITGVPDGYQATVQIDGNELPGAALAQARPVDPGAHTIVAHVGSGPASKTIVDTREGENKDVPIAVKPPPANEPPPVIAGGPQPTKPEKKRSSFPTVMYIIGGAGVAFGLIGGGVALSKKGDLSDKCAEKVCGKDQYGNYDAAHTWATVSTVAVVLGGVALGIGLIAQLSQPSSSASAALPPATPKIGFGLGGLHGSF